MEGFNLIGVFIIKGCNPNIRKSLKEDTFYKFCNRFIVERENFHTGKILDIYFDENKDSFNIYSIPSLEININLSSIINNLIVNKLT